MRRNRFSSVRPESLGTGARLGDTGYLGAAAGALWLVSLWPSLFDAWAWPIRILSGALSIMVVLRLVRTDRMLVLASPLLLLSLLVSCFFSLAPALCLAGLNAELVQPLILAGDKSAPLARYVGSSAERVALNFALLCLTSFTLITRFLMPSPMQALSRKLSSRLILGGVAVTGLCIAVAIAKSGQPRENWDVISRNIADAAAPYGTYTSAVLAALASGSSIWAIMYVGWIVAVFVAFAAAHIAKPLAFVLYASLPVLFCRSRTARPLIIGCLAAALVLAAALTIQNIQRRHFFEGDDGRYHDLLAVTDVLFAKLAFRQSETGNCFQNVLIQHSGVGEWRNLPSLFAGLIPRAVWPDKPSLSHGADYTVRYCDLEAYQVASSHSPSITLLGEPVIVGGSIGLAAAEAFLVVALGALTVFCFRQALPGVVFLVGLSPWLIDFDQGFAMYLANLAKMTLFLIPALLLMWRHARAQ